MYIEREIESTVDAMLRQGKVVLVTGARQVGKTTMLRRHLGDSFAYATMDDARRQELRVPGEAERLRGGLRPCDLPDKGAVPRVQERTGGPRLGDLGCLQGFSRAKASVNIYAWLLLIFQAQSMMAGVLRVGKGAAHRPRSQGERLEASTQKQFIG